MSLNLKSPWKIHNTRFSQHKLITTIFNIFIAKDVALHR